MRTLFETITFVGLLALVSCQPSYANNTVTRVPVTEAVEVCDSKANATGAVVGGVAGAVAGRALFGKKRTLLGALGGAVIGSQVNKDRQCRIEQRIVGYRVFTAADGAIVESYEPVARK